MRSGVVVAGGYSTRFGETDKAVAELAGRALIRRVVDRLDAVVDELVINCRADQQTAISDVMEDSREITYALDETPDRGPVAGIFQGLSHATGEFACVVACDMPFIEPALIRRLFERADGTDGAVPRIDGRRQPLQAVYRREPMCRACAEALENGNPRLLTVLDELECVTVDGIEAVASSRSFENVNTRADLRRAAELLDPSE